MQMIAAAAYFEIFDPSNECMSLPLRTALTHGAKYASGDTRIEHRLHTYLRKVSG
jgi:hypothetical protein